MINLTEQEMIELFKDAPSLAHSYATGTYNKGYWLFDDGFEIEGEEGFYIYGEETIEGENNILSDFEIIAVRPVIEPEVLAYTKKMNEAGELPCEGVQFLDLGSNQPDEVRICLFIDGNRAVYKVGTMSYECADITDCSPLIPPVELVNGLCYQYDYHGPKCGYYKESSSRLISIQGGINPKDVKNLTLLTPEGQ